MQQQRFRIKVVRSKHTASVSLAHTPAGI